MKFSRKVGNGPMNKWSNFGDNPDHHLDTEIVFQICHYRETRKVVNGHKSTAHGGTGGTCRVLVLLVVAQQSSEKVN